MQVTHGSLGPVGTEVGFTPCQFTGQFDGVAVEGTYDPTLTKSMIDGTIHTVIMVCGLAYDATLGPVGPYGLCGDAEPV
jgi:hypothetical protein